MAASVCAGPVLQSLIPATVFDDTAHYATGPLDVGGIDALQQSRFVQADCLREIFQAFLPLI